ncbi:MAG: YwiC-like family protein, partial [Anaerolineales bacterium]
MFGGIWRKHIALPQEHGSWVFILSPLLIGFFAARSFSVDALALIVAAMGAFLLRQPMSILTKISSGRRSPHELASALFWSALYGVATLLALVYLLWRKFT